MATNTTLSAHIVVEFKSEDEQTSTLSVEIDDRENGLNAGKTNFLPGQDAYLLIFKPNNYIVANSFITAGTLSFVQNSTKNVEDFIEFPNVDDISLRYPLSSGFTYSWIGDPAGTLSVTGQTKVSLPPRPVDTNTGLLIPQYRIGVAKINYVADCEVWRISAVPVDVSRVMAFFVATKV